MANSNRWQLADLAAEKYQTVLTPTILGPFAEALVAYAAPAAGETVVDVGCGTGAAARRAAKLVGTQGAVFGVDVNQPMLTVAKAVSQGKGEPAIIWREANANSLPFADGSVERVLSAQMLQFVPQKQAVLAEMRRIMASSGTVAVSVWGALEQNPYFAALVGAMTQFVGPETAVGLRAAFSLADINQIKQLFEQAGFTDVKWTVEILDLPLPPLKTFVPRHIDATPMGAGFRQASAQTQQRIVDSVTAQMAQFEQNGRYQIPFRSYFIKGA